LPLPFGPVMAIPVADVDLQIDRVPILSGSRGRRASRRSPFSVQPRWVRARCRSSARCSENS